MGAGQSKIKAEQIKKAVTTTHFTEEEIKKLYLKFDSLSNFLERDSMISEEEFQTTLGMKSKLFAKRIFDAFDTDKSSKIDFVEFCQGLSAMTDRASLEEHARFCFNVYDIDKNGTIETSELKEVLQFSLMENQSVQINDDQMNAIVKATFSQIDTDGDNLINFDEFLAAAEKNPSMLKCVSVNIDQLLA